MIAAEVLRLASSLSISCFRAEVAGNSKVLVDRERLEGLIGFVRDALDGPLPSEPPEPTPVPPPVVPKSFWEV